MTQVTEPFPIFYDDDGTPLENGMIYIGQANQDPRANPVQVFFDIEETIPASQPIRTLGGRPAYQGAPASLYVSQDSYSIAVFNKYGTPITSKANVFKGSETVSVKDFGAVGNGVTDDTAAIQAAIDAAEATGAQVFFPAGTYVCTATVFVGRTGQVSLIGEGSSAFASENNKGTTLDFSALAADDTALDIGASTAVRRHGIRLSDLNIFRSETNPAVDAGGIGLHCRGLVHFDFERIVTHGFDKGCFITVNGGVCSGGVMNMCRFEENGRAALHMDSGIECRFTRCKFGEGTYQIWLTANGSDRPNGNQWLGGTAIASSVALATNNLRIESGFYNLFDGIAFEQASQQGIYISIPDAEVVQNRITAIFNAIWMDANGGLLCYNGNIAIGAGSRIRSVRSSYPLLEFDSGAGVSEDSLRSVVSNSYLGWGDAGSLSIEINRYYQAVIEGNSIRDESGAGIAFVNFAGGSRCSVTDNDCAGTHRPGWTGTLSGHLFRNRVGSGATGAEYLANDQQQIAGQYIYTAGAQYRQQRSGASAQSSGALWTRTGGGGAFLNLLAVSTSDGTYGNVTASADVGAVRFFAGDSTDAEEIVSILAQTDTNSVANNATGRLRIRTRNLSGSLTDRVTVLSDGAIILHTLPTYADNAAAIAGGLAVNTVYKTATGELRIRV